MGLTPQHPRPRLTSFTIDLISLLASCRSSGFLLFNSLDNSWKRRILRTKERIVPPLPYLEATKQLGLSTVSKSKPFPPVAMPIQSRPRMYFTLDFSSSSKTGFLGRAGGEGISVLSTGVGGSDCTMPEKGQKWQSMHSG